MPNGIVNVYTLRLIYMNKEFVYTFAQALDLPKIGYTYQKRYNGLILF